MYARVINYLAFCTVMGVTDFMIHCRLRQDAGRFA